MVVPVKSKAFISCIVIKSRSGWGEKRKKPKKNQEVRDINARPNVLETQVKSQSNGMLSTIIPKSKTNNLRV